METWRKRNFPADSAGGLEQREGAHHVGVYEGSGAVDRAVDVRLGGEVHHGAGPVLAEDLLHGGRVGDVAAHEVEAGVAGDVCEALEVPRVGQLVEHDDALVGPRQRVAREVAADEACAPGDEPARHG